MSAPLLHHLPLLSKSLWCYLTPMRKPAAALLHRKISGYVHSRANLSIDSGSATSLWGKFIAAAPASQESSNSSPTTAALMLVPQGAMSIALKGFAYLKLMEASLSGTGTGARSSGRQGPRQYQEAGRKGARRRESRPGRSLGVVCGQGSGREVRV